MLGAYCCSSGASRWPTAHATGISHHCVAHGVQVKQEPQGPRCPYRYWALGREILERGEGGAAVRRGEGGGLAGGPVLLGCPITFGTFIMSCENMGNDFSSFCAASCHPLWTHCSI